MAKKEGNFRKWSNNQQVEFIPRELNETCKFEVKWVGEKKKTDNITKEEFKTLTTRTALYVGTTYLGLFWIDGCVLAQSETDPDVPERGIVEIKDGKIMQVTKE